MQDTVKPLTRRESLGYAQILVSLLLLVAFAAVVIQFVTPRPEWVDLGAIDELQSDVPTPRTITRSDGTGLFVWVAMPTTNGSSSMGACLSVHAVAINGSP